VDGVAADASAANPFPVEIINLTGGAPIDAGNPLPTVDAAVAALLTTINGNVDGLEGFTDGLEGKLDTLHTDLSAVTATSLAAAPTKALLAAGVYTLPTPADGQLVPLQVGPNGLLRVGPDGQAVSGTVTSAATLFTQDMLGYESITVQVLSAGTTCTITYETSDDPRVISDSANAVWTPTTGMISTVTATAPVSTTTAVGLWQFRRRGRYFRARVSTFTSGTVTVCGTLSKTDAEPSSTVLVNNTTSYTLTISGTTAIGSRARIQSLATTNATSVKASVGNIYAGVLGNNGGTAAYFKIYNKASAPTVGTDTPIATILIPAGQTIPINLGPGNGFSTGFAYAITGGAADTDTTAVAADQVTGFIAYA
jgi:hypothetical protein